MAPLLKLGRDDRAAAGGKAANLGEMLRAGLPVPDGFCVTTTAFRTWLGNHATATRLVARLEGMAPEATSEIREAAASLRRELMAASLPEPVENAIREQLNRRGGDGPWAVRSSATAEDSPEASFAGQHDSWLNVRGTESVLKAVRDCWASLFTDRAVLYRSRNGIRQSEAAMAAVVQQMVPAEASGVMFTADPLTGNTRALVIEWVRGLGDALVSGRSSPERCVLDKETLRILQHVASHARMELMANPEPECSTLEAGAAGPHQPRLDDTLARRLGELGRSLETLFHRPQDVEWAACDGRVWLVQSRPITALPAAQSTEPEIWTNANVMEALPGVVTPMSWSLMQNLLEDFLNPLMCRLGLNTTGRPLIGLVAGRAYLNLRAIVALVRPIAGPVQVNVMAAFGGQHSGNERALWPDEPRGSRLPSGQKLWRFLRLSAWLIPGLIGQRRIIERWGRRVMGSVARTPPGTLYDEQLAAYPLALLRLAAQGEGERTWAAAAWMATAAVGGSTLVFRLTQKWLNDADHSLANRLLAGASGMNSAENGLELLRLAAWSREQPGLKAALLEPAPFGALQQKLAGASQGREFLERWRTFMEHHGHQARGGMDIAQPRWSEMPDFVLDMLRVYLRLDAESDPLAAQARRHLERKELLAECRRRLRNPLKRWLLLTALRAAHHGLTQRENVKNEGVRMIAILRRAALEAGRRLKERGLLRDPNEVFFLRLEELAPALRGEAALDVPAVVAARKAEQERLRRFEPPPVVVGEYRPARFEQADPIPQKQTLVGVAVSPGVVTGKARVILQLDPADRVEPGEILVAPFTDPGWTPYFLAAAGVVVDVGGLLSHGSVVAREYGLPAVVNVGPATRLIQTGQRLQVDGNRGVVTIVD